jgi:hypothetical protein
MFAYLVDKKRARLILVATALLVVLSLAGSATADDDNEANNLQVITVPCDNGNGEIEALYDAVYLNDQPRENAEIILGACDYPLDPSQPFGGRLVLGQNSILLSTLKMAEDAHGIPEFDAAGEPEKILEHGARIDGSALGFAPFGEGIIVIGNNGLVKNLWVDGGFRPGIEITSRGAIKGVRSTGHSVGARIRTAGEEATGSIDHSLIANNAIVGISVVALDPDLEHPTHEEVEVRASIKHNAVLNSGGENLILVGGIGTNGSEIHARVSHNTFSAVPSGVNVRVVGGFDFQGHGGANDNEVSVILTDNLIANSAVGLWMEASTLNSGFLSDPSIPLEGRQSSNNEAKVVISGNTFQNTTTDIELYGMLSYTGEPGGNDNEATLKIRGNATSLAVESYDCFDAYNEQDFPTCANEAKVKFRKK